MTVCIGAIAERKNAIIMVSDKAITVRKAGVSMQAETGVKKIIPIGYSGWYAMWAGDPTLAADIVSQVAVEIKNDRQKADSWESMMGCIKAAYQGRREVSVVDEILSPHLLTKELLVARSKDLLPLERDHYMEIVSRLDEYEADCSLLVCGFDKSNAPHIFSFDDPGIYKNHDEAGYWAIGIGTQTALARLLEMGISKTDGLVKSLYGAFDAKARAEIMQGVGYGWDAEILPKGRHKSFRIPDELTGLIDRVYMAFPSSPFDLEAKRSPINWHIRLSKFLQDKMGRPVKVPPVHYFKKTPKPSKAGG